MINLSEMDASEQIVSPDFQAFLHLNWRKVKLEEKYWDSSCQYHYSDIVL